ncbi:MAG: hypothetical protein KBC81_01560 [Candidatus Pacebacteria bacterium]|nr:hypothetical protein [Candidatus Paceibacterota bacterium]
MVLTFLNLVVVSGILVGLIQGSVEAQRTQYTSDVIISSLNNKSYIENSPQVIDTIRSLSEIKALSARYALGGTIEANYQNRPISDKPNIAAGQLVGIDPVAENLVTGMSKNVIVGDWLLPTDYDKVVIGTYLLKQYVPVDNPGFEALNNVSIGSKIRLTVGGVSREVIVKGILKSKVSDVSRNVYMVDSQLRSLIGRTDGNVAQIAVKLGPNVDPIKFRDTLRLLGVGVVAKVQTYADAQPQFLKDIINTFSTLGNVLSSIGLIVASVTIFIVIFINALTRRKFIGILKGIGINGQAIEISYIFQSIFYAFCGSFIGLVLVYLILVPLFLSHPIDFPFSDGILVAPVFETAIRVGLLVLSTLIAGYIPARMIVRKNTLDSILGRN